MNLLQLAKMAEMFPNVKVEKLGALKGLMSRRLESLTVVELRDLSEAMGLKVNVTDELKSAAFALLQGKSLDTVADLVGSPESMKQVVSFLKGGFKEVATLEFENHPDWPGVSQLTLTIIER